MAGTVTLTTTKVANSGGVWKYSLAWTSDAAGAVSGTLLTLLPGTIVTVEFVPGTGGTQPTDLYDVDFLDPEGVSAFNDGTGTSIGANLSNVNASHKIPFIAGATTTYARTWLHGGTGYQLSVTNAGNAKSGTVNIFLSPNAF